MKRTGLLSICVSLALLLPGCGWFGGDTAVKEPQDYPVEAGGVTLSAPPERVLVLSPSLAEVAADMGFSGRLCGRSEECDAPQEVAALPSAGRMQLPDKGAVTGLESDLVLTQSPLSDTASALFEELKIPVAVIPAAVSFADMEEMYRQVGRLFAGEQTGTLKGGAALQELKGRLAAVAERVSPFLPEERPAALYAADIVGSAATGDTVAQTVLHAAGLANGAQEGTGWVLPEGAAAAAQWIFCPVGQEEAVISAALYANSPAVQNGRVIGVDAALFERQGWRLSQAALLMAKTVYPEAFADGGTDEPAPEEEAPSDEAPTE